MGGKFLPPDDLAPLFDKPGRTWSHAERLSVQEWLNSELELAKQLRLVALYLGSGTTFQDAEDTWAKFNIYYSERHERWVSPLHNVMKQYDPVRGRFQALFYTSLQRFCGAERDSIKKRDHPQIKGDLPDVRSNPERLLIEKEGKEAQRQKVHKAINALSERYRTVIKMYYFEGMSVEKLAEAIKKTKPSVKTNLFRGRQILKGLLGGGNSS